MSEMTTAEMVGTLRLAASHGRNTRPTARSRCDELEAIAARLSALDKVAKAAKELGVRSLVAGWQGERSVIAYPKHPHDLGVTLRTCAGVVYELDAALKEAGYGE